MLVEFYLYLQMSLCALAINDLLNAIIVSLVKDRKDLCHPNKYGWLSCLGLSLYLDYLVVEKMTSVSVYLMPLIAFD